MCMIWFTAKVVIFITFGTGKTKKARSKQDDSVSDAEIPLFGEKAIMTR